MAACQPVTFKNISQPVYRAILARVRAQAATFADNGNSGSATGDTPLGQVSSSWTYDETAQTLIITCTKKPFLVSEGLLAAKMQALVQSVTSQA